ncbi:MAG: hypothetical protein WD267_11545 [Balneolales bacterium]
MLKAKILGILFTVFFISGTVFAQPDKATQAENELKKYVNHVVEQVKSTYDPDEKRVILNKSIGHLSGSLNTVKKNMTLTDQDQEFIDRFIHDLQEKKDELNGLNGFSKVQDVHLNDFTDYMQQDIEQANRTITISVTTALLLALILVLIAS